jgi:hypothetical protein
VQRVTQRFAACVVHVGWICQGCHACHFWRRRQSRNESVKELVKRWLYNPKDVDVSMDVPAVIASAVQYVREYGFVVHALHLGSELVSQRALDQRVPQRDGRKVQTPVHVNVLCHIVV